MPGVLPKDAASIGSLSVTAAATAAAVAASGDDNAEPDAVVMATRGRRIHHQQQQAMSDLICGKPGPLTSHFMAQKGLQPPSKWQQRLVGPLATKAQGVPVASGEGSMGADSVDAELLGAKVGDGDGTSSSGSSAKAVARQCLNEAAAAVSKYQHSKRAAALHRKKGMSALHQEQRQLEQQKQLVSKQAQRCQDVSNVLSGQEYAMGYFKGMWSYRVIHSCIARTPG